MLLWNDLILISGRIKLEVYIGMNGKIWVRAETFSETVKIGNLLLSCELLGYDEILSLTESYIKWETYSQSVKIGTSIVIFLLLHI